jgi:hypothetical protein
LAVERQDDEEIRIDHYATIEIIADGLTKALGKVKY